MKENSTAGKQVKQKRWRLFADLQLQGNLCLRVIFYWILCQMSIFGTIAAFTAITQGSSRSLFVVPAFIVSSVILLVALFDMVKFSNRFVGPMVNLRKHLQIRRTTGSMSELRFRDGDYFIEICEAINELNAEVMAQTNNSSDDVGDPIQSSKLRSECHV